MKTIICNIPMKEKIYKCYLIDSIKKPEGNFEVAYPINVELAKSLKKNEKFNVLLLKSIGGSNRAAKNIQILKDELEYINKAKDLNADITYEEIVVPFSGQKYVWAEIFRRIIDKIKKDSDIYADVTYGTKLLPMIVFCALNFAEKYLDVEVTKILYGMVEFGKKGIIIPGSGAIFDITMLYCLNSLTNNIDCDNPETAIKIIDDFLAL